MEEVLRNEKKYALSLTDYFRLRPMLEAVLLPDPHDPQRQGYEIRSLYFDSARDDDLWDVLSGLRCKQKIRLRCYDAHAEDFKLEYKCKTGTDSRKYSIPLGIREAEQLIAGRYDCLLERPEGLAKELYARMKSQVYLPRVTVVYQRIVHMHRLNDVRITYDFHVRACFDPRGLIDPQACFTPVTPPDTGILEVKYNHFLPGFVQTALGNLDSLPVANSKYANARLWL